MVRSWVREKLEEINMGEHLKTETRLKWEENTMGV